MPNIKKPRRDADATNLTIDPDSGTVAGTDNTDFGQLGWFTTSAEGCTVRFGIEQQGYGLAVTLPNYNALFSQLLACWLNGCRLSLTFGIRRSPAVDPNAPLNIVSITALPPGSEG